ncbi:MAG: hypothetical protein SAJ72_24585, partial [Jaaginema sp. PMC 1080.18]|nr:hypothetical protein [Jaaginema sp. PMC 1080.18]MEC4869191.1 hypothetical protein [Jaaginema sp. PMC 1078.18]
MTFPDNDAGVQGWKYIKPSKDGLWGIHVPDDGKIQGKAWQDVIAERNRLQQQRLEEEARQRAEALSVEARSP